MLSQENHTSRAIALAAMARLRENFHLVSRFIEHPQESISLAERKLQDNKARGLKPESDRISRHQAKTALLLSIQKLIDLQRELNALTSDVCNFDSEDDAKGNQMLEHVLATGRKTEAWSAHISNCLNVIKGTEEKILHPSGPAI